MFGFDDTAKGIFTKILTIVLRRHLRWKKT